MNTTKYLYLLLLYLIVSGSVLGQTNNNEKITFTIKDIHTEVRIPAFVEVVNENQKQLKRANEEGVFSIADKTGRIDLKFAAVDYKTLETYFLIESDTDLHVNILMEKLSGKSLVMPDTPSIQGFVRDTQGNPIKNASVKIKEFSGVKTKTDDTGAYYMPLNLFPTDISELDKLHVIVEKKGFLPNKYKFNLIRRQILSKNFELSNTQKKINPNLHPIIDNLPPKSGATPVIKKTDLEKSIICPSASTIRVGTNCSCNSCNSVDVLSMEAYVGSGLNDEWIASWNSESLKTGAVAYRTYGTYYALNPYSSNYDIASTPCKQAWDSDEYSSCVNAAAATLGEVMVNGQGGSTIAFSEYSAENNDCGCGDGYAGTGNAWPCINDYISAGEECYGHGRGVSQWGSSRWANNGKSYTWILDHYYNPGGFYRCEGGNDNGGGNDTPPSNDECNNAIPLTFLGENVYCQLNTTLAGATPSLSPVNCSGYTSDTSNDVWYSFTASASEANIGANPSSGLDLVLAVYDGCGNNDLIDCVDNGGGEGDSENITISNLNIGSTYFIRIYNYSEGGVPPSTTDFNICLAFEGNPDPDTDHDFYIENLTTDKNSYTQGEQISIDCDQYTAAPDAADVDVTLQYTVRSTSGSVIEVLGEDISGLGNGDEEDGEGINTNLPTGLPSTVQICAEANYDGAVSESNTANNLSCITVNIGSTPTNNHDFYIENLTTDKNSYTQGEQISIDCDQYTTAPDAADVDVILQYTVRSTGGSVIEVLGEDISVLGNGDEEDGEGIDTNLPTGLPSSVQICAEANYNNAAPESNTSNNLSCVTITIIEESNPCDAININPSPQITDANCSTSGSITLTPTGGQAPYTYVWSNGQTGNTITENAGRYTATITDANGCTTNGSFTIESTGTNLSINVQSTNATCDNQGSATATTSGGQAPFTYTWNDGYEGEDRPNLPNGTYTLTVTDANGCTAQQSVTITGEGTPLTLFQTENPSTCEGGTGNALVSATGGNGNYTFAWSNGATTPQISNVLAGTYTVAVNDSNGCSATTSVEIMNEEFTIDCVIPQNATCGASDGEILVKMLNATPPLTYLWSNGTTINPATGLGAGNHTVSITDGNGCTITTSGYINYDVPMYEFVTTPISCAGESDGAVEVYPTGGTPPFTYTWANGETGPYLNNLGAGTYNVMISDTNGCNSSRTVTIEAPQPMSANLALTADQCGITANPNGGTSPYIYTWANGETTNELTDIQGDNTYRLTITDANGCTHTDSLYIPIDAGMPDTNFDYLIENGRLMLMGNPNMTNEWLVDSKWSSNITNPQFPAIPGTMVMVQHTITNPCGSVTTSEMIEIPNSITALDYSEILTGIQISPNPFNDYLLIDMGTLRGEFELRIYNALGQVIFTQNERITNAQLPINPSIRASGMYHLSIIEKDTQRIFTQKIVKVN